MLFVCVDRWINWQKTRFKVIHYFLLFLIPPPPHSNTDLPLPFIENAPIWVLVGVAPFTKLGKLVCPDPHRRYHMGQFHFTIFSPNPFKVMHYFSSPVPVPTAAFLPFYWTGVLMGVATFSKHHITFMSLNPLNFDKNRSPSTKSKVHITPFHLPMSKGWPILIE